MKKSIASFIRRGHDNSVLVAALNCSKQKLAEQEARIQELERERDEAIKTIVEMMREQHPLVKRNLLGNMVLQDEQTEV